MIPLSLYVHFPWCVKKCPYCDFNSHEVSQPLQEDLYIDALEADLVADLEALEHNEIISIFMGGGTPSLFSPVSIQDLLDRLKKHTRFATDIEITLEANPGTTDYEKFAGYFAAGINRLSIGVQSFNPEQLDMLGRIHSAGDVFNAYEAARRAGFTNINLDLMHGLSHQSVNDAMLDLKTAIELEPTHISWYQLTIEPNTVFFKRPPTLPDDDLLWEIYTNGLQLLDQNAYQRYEISAFCQGAYQSRHNLNYWLFGDYLGIGAGAHGKITRNNQVIRTSKSRSPKDYLNTPNARRVESKDLILEFLMNALRLTQGFSLSLFSERTGLPASALLAFLTAAKAKNLVIQDGEKIVPTKRGLQYLNDLLLLID